MKNKWTEANRLTEVTKHEVTEVIVGSSDVPLPKNLKFIDGTDASQFKDGDSVWRVWYEGRTGLDEGNLGIIYCASEDEAKNLASAPTMGTIFGEFFGFPMRLREYLESYSGDDIAGVLALMFARTTGGSDDHCYDALHGAGVLVDLQIAPVVLEWAGEKDIAWMQERFGENWSVLAEYEYCLHHYPASSLATIAAHIRVSQYITFDKLTEGYLTKLFEVIYFGTERAAMSATKLRKNAGKGGGRVSKTKKDERLQVFIEEIEKLHDVVEVMSEDRVVEQAYENARKRRPDMPKTPRTVLDYETCLRSYEPYKSRYFAVFNKTA